MEGRTFSSTFDFPGREKEQPTSTYYPNPIALAQEWQQRLYDGEAASRVELARILKASRAHVTQVLLLLTMALEAKDMVLAFGDPLQGRFLGVHTLRRLCNLSADEPQRRIKEMLNFC